MPGLIVEPEKKLQEDDPIVQDDDADDFDVGDDTEDDDEDDTDDSDHDNDDEDDNEDGTEEPITGEQLAELESEVAELKREVADIKMMVEDNFKQISLMLAALTNKALEIIAQRSACPSVSHEPGPTPASTTVDSVASKPDPPSSSPAPVVDPPPAAIGCTPDRAPIEMGDTHMPDAAA